MSPPPVTKKWAIKSTSDIWEQDELLAGEYGDFPGSDNPVKTERNILFTNITRELVQKKLFISVSNTLCLTGPAKSLAAGFGVF